MNKHVIINLCSLIISIVSMILLFETLPHGEVSLVDTVARWVIGIVNIITIYSLLTNDLTERSTTIRSLVEIGIIFIGWGIITYIAA